MTHKYLIVDDEPFARKLILTHASKINGLELAGECDNALEAGVSLRTRNVDLIFLDIQMPELNGLDFIKSLKHAPQVIFTTAHRDFAAEAFDVDAVDYLLKPISFERLFQSVNKFFDRVAVKKPIENFADAGDSRTILIKADRKTHKIALDDIQYIESLDNFVKVHLKNGVLVSRENISLLESKLPGKRFVRIHRSFLVSIVHVTSITAEGVELNKKNLPFGRAYKMAAMSALGFR